ncbi:MAG: aspartate dehydrogenase [Lachnospiraceae bacterium]
MFFKKKKEKIQVLKYDKEKEIPVLRCSICTGEQVAGFKDIHTGKIRDLMLIKSEQDLEEFKMTYGVDELKKVY